jgi:hypothetical protein
MSTVKSFFSFSILLVCLSLSAQDIYKRKAIYGEVGGSGVFGSINYDFRFNPGRNDGIGMRIGGSFIPGVVVIPIELNNLIGKNRIALEYGGGVTAAYFYDNTLIDLTLEDQFENFGVIAFGKVGVRYTPVDNGLFLNFNYYAMVNHEGLIPVWLGLGIGYSWKKGWEPKKESIR